jgi:hypothetical protein
MPWLDTKYIGRNTADNDVSTSAVTADADGTVLERLEYVQTVLGGGASALRTVISDSETVEENAIQYFNIGIFDIDAGAIASASITITGISAVLEKSTGGGAFSSVGITQPIFSKADGSVYCAYQFLAAQWTTGDMYKLVVSGITATIHSTTAYVPTAVWSNVVVETEDIKNDVQYLYGVADGGTTSPTKVIDNSILSIIMTKQSGGDTSDFDNSTDSLEAIADSITEGSLQIEADAGSTASVIIDAAILTQVTTDWWKGALLLSINGDNSGQARPVVSFNTTTDAVTVSPPFLAAPTAGDDFLVISGFKMPEWVPVAATAISADAVVSPGVDLLDLVDTDNKETYRLNNLRIKCADPGANTVTITLYELINNVSTAVDTFAITTDNYTTYFSLFDMFGLTHVSGDDITVNATSSAGSYAITGNYQYDISYTA